MDEHALIAQFMPLAEALAGAHSRRTGADRDEVRSDAYLGLVIAVQKWLLSDRRIAIGPWVSSRVVWTMKDEWRIREGRVHKGPAPVNKSLAEMTDNGYDLSAPEPGYQAVEDRAHIRWLAREAADDPDMHLAVAATQVPLAELAAVQQPPVTDSRVCQRVRKGRRKLRDHDLAAA